MGDADRAVFETAVGAGRKVEGIRTYVDDLKISKVGSPDASAAALRQAVLALKGELERDGMVLELSKCQAMGTSAAHRTVLKARMEELGVQTVDTARDLGTDAAPGSRRRVRVLKIRLKAGRARLSRLARAPLPKARRAMHAQTLGATVATYGVEVQGMAPTMLKELRRAMVTITRKGGGPGSARSQPSRWSKGSGA